MASLRTALPQAIAEMGGSMDELAKLARAQKVRSMWETLMKLGGDDYILAHTNNVFIFFYQSEKVRNSQKK